MTAAPQDHLDALKNAPKLLSFTIDGQNISLPNWVHVKPGVLRDASKQGNDFDLLWFVLEAVCDEDTLAVVKNLDTLPWGELMNQWQQGAALGESSSSAN